MEFVVIRKLLAGIVLLLVALGVIKASVFNKHRWLRIVCGILGVFLLLSSLLYQFNVIPESHVDSLFN